MSIAYEIPGFAAAEATSLRAPEWDDPDPNELQAALEERCEDEIDRLDAYFTEWLADDGGPWAHELACAVMGRIGDYWSRVSPLDRPSDDEIAADHQSRIENAKAAIREAYIAHRANDATLMGELADSIEED